MYVQGKLTDEQKDNIKARHAEMKALKSELWEKSNTNWWRKTLTWSRIHWKGKIHAISMDYSTRQQVTTGIDSGEFNVVKDLA